MDEAKLYSKYQSLVAFKIMIEFMASLELFRIISTSDLRSKFSFLSSVTLENNNPSKMAASKIAESKINKRGRRTYFLMKESCWTGVSASPIQSDFCFNF